MIRLPTISNIVSKVETGIGSYDDLAVLFLETTTSLHLEDPGFQKLPKTEQLSLITNKLELAAPHRTASIEDVTTKTPSDEYLLAVQTEKRHLEEHHTDVIAKISTATLALYVATRSAESPQIYHTGNDGILYKTCPTTQIVSTKEEETKDQVANNTLERLVVKLEEDVELSIGDDSQILLIEPTETEALVVKSLYQLLENLTTN